VLHERYVLHQEYRQKAIPALGCLYVDSIPHPAIYYECGVKKSAEEQGSMGAK
jgi:hypothetical protein